MKKVIFSFLTFLLISSIKSTSYDLSQEITRNGEFSKLFSKNLRFLKTNDLSSDNCDRRVNPFDPNAFYFLPVFKAKLYKKGDKVEFKSLCFKKNTATLKEISLEKLTIELETTEKTSFLCQDTYILHTTNINLIQTFIFPGTHEITLTNLTQDDLDEIKVNGIKLVGFCQGLISSLRSLFETLKAFVGGLGYDPEAVFPLFRPTVPEYMIEANKRILETFNNYTFVRRDDDSIVDIDETLIHTGDFIGISRLDGVDPIIMIGTGSHIGHSVVCAWINNELYVLESQDGWYWPYHGIQKNKFKDWIRLAHNADFNVVLLPLREDVRKRFNETKALEWFFNGIEGLNYGYHNFLLSWIDTPDSNMPSVLSHEHLEFVFSIAEKLYPPLAQKMLGEALNMRVGIKNLTIPQATAEAARQGKSFEQIIAEPEKEGWVYSDGLNYVCSCFVIAFYKAGGLFDGMEINPNEFTPKDVYQLNIWDTNFKRPKVCEERDPDLPYCQLMGKWKIDLPGYSTIDPYSNMNEKCPSIGPDFYRPEGC